MFKNSFYRFTFSIFILFIGSVRPASDLDMPKEVKKAYEKQTRSKDGKPGSNYWQNFSEYDIKILITPENRLLTGSETITYYNNSPDSLKYIVLKLYQNMNKKGAARNFALEESSVTNGVDITNLKIDKIETSLNPEKKKVTFNGTNMVVNLSSPLAPNKSVSIEVDWNFTIPEGQNIRMGTYDPSTFFLGYWYPKVAVYDDIRGWDLFNYNGEHEFYFDYSNIRAEIKVPAGYGVWATGELLNPDEVLNDEFLDRYNNSLLSDRLIKIVSGEDSAKTVYKDKNGFTSFKYLADNISDFAFGISNHFLWDGLSIEIEPGRRVGCFAVYKSDSEYFYKAAEQARRSIEFFSNEMPGVIYPYSRITVFNGEGGMEFPMIVNDGVFNNEINDVYVTTHEIAHMYFPFYVGTNESRYGWMDEGMAYFLPLDLQIELSEFNHRTRAAVGYSKWSGNDQDIPLILPSFLSRDVALGVMSYYKPALAYEMLENALGEATFKSALQEFIKRWNGKHPTPWDFFYTFEDVTKKDLSWFWKPWFFETHIPDLAIKDLKFESNQAKILVENVGAMPLPIDITITLEDGSNKNLSAASSIWENGDKEVWLSLDVNSKVNSVELLNKDIPDADATNNQISF